MTERLTDFLHALAELMLDAGEELTPAEAEMFLDQAAGLVAAAMAGRWDHAPDRPPGWS